MGFSVWGYIFHSGTVYWCLAGCTYTLKALGSVPLIINTKIYVAVSHCEDHSCSWMHDGKAGLLITRSTVRPDSRIDEIHIYSFGVEHALTSPNRSYKSQTSHLMLGITSKSRLVSSFGCPWVLPTSHTRVPRMLKWVVVVAAHARSGHDCRLHPRCPGHFWNRK